MKNLLLFVMTFVIVSWAVPKPMESVENYNILMVHGAYGASKGFGNILCVFSHVYDSLPWPIDSLPSWEVLKPIYYKDSIPELVDNYIFLEANEDTSFLGEANIGYYGSHGRLTYWLNKRIFEDDSSSKPQTSYTYHWRSFSNPANSSSNNARELGDRKWNGCGQRRALIEEVQEVKAIFYNSGTGQNDSGQVALQEMRKDPNLYRQIPSRYTLIGHSMGGIASREWIQNSNYYYGDVDKVIALDSPHEGIAALSCPPVILETERWGSIIFIPYICAGVAFNFCFYTCSRSFK